MTAPNEACRPAQEQRFSRRQIGGPRESAHRDAACEVVDFPRSVRFARFPLQPCPGLGFLSVADSTGSFRSWDIIRSMIETSLFALAVAVPFVCVVGGLLFLTITGLARYRTEWTGR